MEGDSVTIYTGLTEIKNYNVIQWKFEDDDKTETLIAEFNKQADRIAVYDDVLDGIFRDRLKLNKHTGSLTITNITTEHAGYYKHYPKSFWRSHTTLSVFGRLNICFTILCCNQTK